jgi:hypothetical protein
VVDGFDGDELAIDEAANGECAVLRGANQDACERWVRLVMRKWERFQVGVQAGAAFRGFDCFEEV